MALCWLLSSKGETNIYSLKFIIHWNCIQGDFLWSKDPGVIFIKNKKYLHFFVIHINLLFRFLLFCHRYLLISQYSWVRICVYRFIYLVELDVILLLLLLLFLFFLILIKLIVAQRRSCANFAIYIISLQSKHIHTLIPYIYFFFWIFERCSCSLIKYLFYRQLNICENVVRISKILTMVWKFLQMHSKRLQEILIIISK